MKSYFLSVSDYRKLQKFFLFIAIISLLALAYTTYELSKLDKTEASGAFILALAGLGIGIPLLFLLVLSQVSHKTNVKLDQHGIETNKLGFISYHQILDTKKPMNRYGNNTLLILHLSDGRKISFSPSTRYSGEANETFRCFVSNLYEQL